MNAAPRTRSSDWFSGALGPLYLLIASLLWGTTGTAASFLPASVSPLATGAATMALGGAVLFGIAGSSSVRALRAASSRPFLLLGAVGVVIYPLAFYLGMDLAGVAAGNVVALGSGPLFAALLEWAVDRRRPSKRWAIATAVSVAGIVLLGMAGTGGPDPVAGVVAGLIAGAAYALYTWSSSRAIHTGVASSAAMGAMFGVGGLLLVPVLIVLGAPLLESPSTVGISLYLAIGPMFVAYVLFGRALVTVRSSTATTITLLEPVVATLLAVLVVGERLVAAGWAGLVLIVAGVVIVSTGARGRVAPGSRPGPTLPGDVLPASATDSRR